MKAVECDPNSAEQKFEFKPTLGLVHTKTDLCVTAPRPSYVQATVDKCKWPKKQWFMRANNQMVPIGFEQWLGFFAKRRRTALDKYQKEINEVLAARTTRKVVKPIHRRCVVHFADDNHLGAAPQFRVSWNGMSALLRWLMLIDACMHAVVGHHLAAAQAQRGRPSL